jgi:hypothetical protein
MSQKTGLLMGLVVLACGWLAGCAKPAGTTSPAPATQVAAKAHGHDGWWCNEHGVPEEVCALCNAKLVADFKAKGDWCQEHDRPDSQCFVCHPEKEAEFAAQYEAKYGAKPPKPQSD